DSATQIVWTPFGERLPEFPPEDIQLTTTGLSRDATIKQAFAFYEDILQAISRAGSQIDRSWRVLDFGACWGRIARLFMRHVDASQIVGLDVDPAFVELANTLFLTTQFRRCHHIPPTNLDQRSVNLITAYSVFSHLSEQTAVLWVEEFARILVPGGF